MVRFIVIASLLLFAVSPVRAENDGSADESWQAALAESRSAVAAILESIVDRIETDAKWTEELRRQVNELDLKQTSRLDDLETSLKSLRFDWSEANSLMLQIPEADRSAIRAERLHVVRNRTQETVWIAKNEPLVLEFEANILWGFKPHNADLAFEKEGQHLVVFLHGEIPAAGAAIVCCLENGKYIALRIREATGDHPPDVKVQVGVNS